MTITIYRKNIRNVEVSIKTAYKMWLLDNLLEIVIPNGYINSHAIYINGTALLRHEPAHITEMLQEAMQK